MTARRHFKSLDGMRGVAALAVVVFHWKFWLFGGQLFSKGNLAVPFFFILSGFVIDHAFSERLKTDLSLREFIKRRVNRLYPMIIFGAAIGAFVYYLDPYDRNTLKESALIVPNTLLAMLCLPSPMGWLDHPFSINRPMWSLFFEIFANIAFAVLWFRMSLKALIVAAPLGVFGSILLIYKFGTLSVGTEFNDLPWGVLAVSPPFLVGVLLSRIRELSKVPSLSFPLASSILILTFIPPSFGKWDGLYELLTVYALFPILILAAQRSDPTVRWERIAKFGADISYPIYIVHMPVTELIGPSLLKLPMPFLFRLLAQVASALIVATFVERLYERPIRTFLSSRHRPKKAEPAPPRENVS